MGNYVKVNTFFILNFYCGETLPIGSEQGSQKAAELDVPVMGCLPQELPSSAQSLPAPSPAALVSGKKENPGEPSKSPSSIYNLLPPLTVP